jgi:hypothetical protein
VNYEPSCIPSLRATFHPSYCAEFKQYIITMKAPGSELSPPVTAPPEPLFHEMRRGADWVPQAENAIQEEL